MELSETTKTALQDNGVFQLTDMQQQAFEHALLHENLLVQAPTGSGKTTAYILPILESLELQGKGKHFPCALILCPTRELCQQTADVIRSYLKNREGIRTLVLCGGVDMNSQIKMSARGADIIVGTPARINDHLRRHTFKPKMCHTLVLDEADDMLSMGFKDDVMKILSLLPIEQTMLFSATFDKAVISFAKEILKDPWVYQASKQSNISAASYHAYIIDEKKKTMLIQKQVLSSKGQILIFTNKRNTADYVSELLAKKGCLSGSIHSEMDMKLRTHLMHEFRQGRLHVLCATEVAARGMDIGNLDACICYDLPLSLTDLIHRFGRAGRMNHQADVILYITPSESKNLAVIKQHFPSLIVHK